MKIEKKTKYISFFQYFFISKPFKVIFTDFVLLRNKIEKFNFLRGEPYFYFYLNSL